MDNKFWLVVSFVLFFAEEIQNRKKAGKQEILFTTLKPFLG